MLFSSFLFKRYLFYCFYLIHLNIIHCIYLVNSTSIWLVSYSSLFVNLFHFILTFYYRYEILKFITFHCRCETFKSKFCSVLRNREKLYRREKAWCRNFIKVIYTCSASMKLWFFLIFKQRFRNWWQQYDWKRLDF